MLGYIPDTVVVTMTVHATTTRTSHTSLVHLQKSKVSWFILPHEYIEQSSDTTVGRKSEMKTLNTNVLSCTLTTRYTYTLGSQKKWKIQYFLQTHANTHANKWRLLLLLPKFCGPFWYFGETGKNEQAVLMLYAYHAKKKITHVKLFLFIVYECIATHKRK